MDDSKQQVDDDSQVYLAPFQNSVLHPSHVRVFLIVSFLFNHMSYVSLNSDRT